MARGCSQFAGRRGYLHHSVVRLLLLHFSCSELEGSEEEDGMLSYILAREKGFHASNKVCFGQREL